MTRVNRPLLIAVDGGGTLCRLAALSGGTRVEVTGGAANVSTDFDGAMATIRDGLARLSAAAGASAAQMAGAQVYLGLAGVVSADLAARVAAGVPAARVQVEDDRPAAVLGALGQADGCVVGLGTGSFLARHAEGGITLRGGWGLRLGDEASGGWLGRALLARVLHVHDGMAEASPLTRAVLSEFGADPGALVAFSLRAVPADYAAYAPRILAAARQGDAVAVDLMRAGADYLTRGLHAIGWRPGEALCLTGGLGSGYASWLPAGMQAALIPPKGSALDGALALARRLDEGCDDR
ncbi:MAG: BadF/BadG/BcrA/BcrD ATPase family protein [Qingshengfaniella sp.]